MSYNFSPLPNWQLSDGNGKPYAGGLLYTYEAGTTTPKTTYNDDDTANTNPIVLDSEGRATVKLGAGKYRMVFTDGASATLFDSATIEGVTVWDIDNVGSDINSISTVTNIAALKAISAGDINVGDAVIVQGYSTANDGGGGVFTWNASSTSTNDGGVCVKPTDGTTGRWFRLFNGGVNPRWWGAVGNGTTSDTTAFTAAINYAVSNSCEIVLDQGTFYLATDPGLTTSNVRVVLNAAILKPVGFHLNINAVIPISDINRHFNYTTGDEPVFPATTEIKNIWLDGSTAGWYQHTLALQSDMTTAQADILNLKGAVNNTLIIQDNGGTWVAGSLKVSVNGTEYTQSWVTDKDTSLGALTTQIAANSDVASTSYSSSLHSITIAPKAGKSLYIVITVTGISGGSTVTFSLVRQIDESLHVSKRLLLTKGQTASTANNITLDEYGNLFRIDGYGDINLISSIGWIQGSEITLYVSTFGEVGGPTFKHNQTPVDDYKPIFLSDSIDYTIAENGVLTLVYDGTYWREKSRSNFVKTISGSFTATFPTNKTITINYTKYSDGLVRLDIPAKTGLDSGDTHTATGTPLPATIRPSNDTVSTINMKSNDIYSVTPWTSSLILTGALGGISIYSQDVSGESISDEILKTVVWYTI